MDLTIVYGARRSGKTTAIVNQIIDTIEVKLRTGDRERDVILVLQPTLAAASDFESRLFRALHRYGYRQEHALGLLVEDCVQILIVTPATIGNIVATTVRLILVLVDEFAFIKQDRLETLVEQCEALENPPRMWFLSTPTIPSNSGDTKYLENKAKMIMKFSGGYNGSVSN